MAPLYGSVDPAVHRPVAVDGYRADLSYLGTFAADRQAALEELFVVPARQHPTRRFLLGGACYPTDFPWTTTSSSSGTCRPASTRPSSAPAG